MTRLVAWARELKRRKVVQVTGVYLVFAWGASLGIAELLPTFDAPLWVVQTTIIALFAFTPVAAVLAWYFEITQQGVVRDPQDVQPAAETQFEEQELASGVVVRWADRGQARVKYLSGDFTLGRDASCTIVVHHPSASRVHARVERVNDQWVLNDLDSSNGTMVDGKRVNKSVLVGIHALSLGNSEPIEVHVADQ